VALCRASRPADPAAPEFVKKYVSWGAGPRASQYLVLAAKARAILAGRYAAAVEDVRALAAPVLVHRVLPNFHAEADGMNARALVERLMDAIRPA
jgi:MoxR-like ATPase